MHLSSSSVSVQQPPLIIDLQAAASFVSFSFSLVEQLHAPLKILLSIYHQNFKIFSVICNHIDLSNPIDLVEVLWTLQDYCPIFRQSSLHL